MPVTPIPLARDADGHPCSTLYGDVYASRDGAAAQARHVFLNGNGLPDRWRGRDQFAVLETGFGLGTNFLATWQAWHDDAARCGRLHFVSVEKHPLSAEALLSAASSELQPLARRLARQWPLPIEGLHRLEFDGGAVVLTLALGDARDAVPQLVVGADAIFLDGFAPDRNPQMWEPALLKAVARCARAGATLATWCTARLVRDALAQAGFDLQLAAGFGRKRDMLTGRYAPRWRTRRHEPPAARHGGRSALVVGAGLAGSACAHALVRRGWQVQVIDDGISAGHPPASALPWGLLHPHLAVDDAPLARLVRAGVAATHAALARTLSDACRHEGEPVARTTGLLQLAGDEAELLRWRVAIDELRFPSAHVQACDADTASAYVGLRTSRGGLWWPQGALISPRRWRHALTAQCTLLPGRAHAVQADTDGRWQVVDDDGGVLGRAPVVIVAAALSSPVLVGSATPRVHPVRGRITQLHAGALRSLRAPVAGDGYLMHDPDGGAWIGATYETALPGDASDGALSDGQATAGNLRRAAALLAEPLSAAAIGTFDAVRCVAHDRLPLAGALADEPAALANARALRGAHLADLPRRVGLHASYALGSRGLALAPLLGDMIAAQIEGEPLPLPRDLAAQVDPARFLLHALRHGRDVPDSGTAREER